jgi:hypothetical protein
MIWVGVNHSGNNEMVEEVNGRCKAAESKPYQMVWHEDKKRHFNVGYRNPSHNIFNVLWAKCWNVVKY